MKKLLCIVAALALVACGVNTANASFVLVIDDPNTTALDVIVIDEEDAGATSDGGYTSNADDGVQPAPNSIGAFTLGVGGFTITITTALTKDMAANYHQIHLHVSFTGKGELLIGVTATDFPDWTPPLDALQLSGYDLDSAVADDVEFQGEKDWLDDVTEPTEANREFSGSFGMDDDDQDATVNLTGNGVAYTSIAGLHGDHSMTLYAHLDIDDTITESFDVDLEQIPEPSSLAIFAGLALLGALWIRRRKNR